MSSIEDAINDFIESKKEALSKNEHFAAFGKVIKGFQFGKKAQLAFLEDLCTLVSDGIPPNRAIEMLAQVATGRAKEVALSISDRIGEGQGLADGMMDWFSVEVVEIIRVGEEGGALSQTMKSGIDSMRESSGVMGAFLGAMIYPMVVIFMCCAIIVYLRSSVFEQFKAIKPIAAWPSAGQQLMALADFISRWWWGVLTLVIIFVLILRKMLTTYVGEFRAKLDSVPPFIFYRKIVAARFMETLGLLVSNGVVVKNALKVMQHQASPYMTSHLVMMEHLLGMGKGNIADVLSTGLIDERDIKRLRVMAEVKGFEHGLVRMGIHGREQTVKTLKMIGKIIGGFLMAIGAVLIIMILRGIFLTGMSMGQQ